jgi:uncharacterized membrane protein
MQQQPKTNRILSIDVLRGLIMVIMALDHVRDFYSNVQFNPLDLTQTSPQLFLTRWITHFCAPIFVFLSGTSAFLSLAKGKTKKQQSLFLLSRGLWLIFIELAVINLLWSFDITYSFLGVQVIWAIGWSMIFLAALIFLPTIYIAVIGLIIVFGHNAFDNFHVQGSGKLFWMILHEQGPYPISKNWGFFVMYPIVPWIGVMALGYSFGTLFKLEVAQRTKWLLSIGTACIVLFITIRYTNMYGDKNLWVAQDSWWKTILSFIDCTKYPPSLLYLLMTLGPAMFLLVLFEKMSNPATRFVAVYGRVPFFYYLLHLIIIHGSAVIIAAMLGKTVVDPLQTQTWGFGLVGVYTAWVIIIAALYLPCKWFMQVKARRKDWWLSYL